MPQKGAQFLRLRNIMHLKKLKKAMAIGALLSIAIAGPCMAQSATITLTSAKQEIKGFGGIHIGSWNGGDLTDAQRLTAFGNADGQIGMSIFRVFIDPDSTQWSAAVPTAKFAQAHGATLFASPWNPPSGMTETFGTAGKWRLKTTSYAAYTNHLNAFIAYMKKQGVTLYAISVQNEPDYGMTSWCSWTADEILNFMKNNAGNITGAKVIAPESFQYVKSMSDPILNDATALANMDILGAHLYGTTVANYPYPLFKTKGAGKELWMTEVYTESNNDADLWPLALDVGTMIHNAMVEAEFQVFTWWTIRRKYSPIKEDGTVSKRGYCFAQYSKFVRPGFIRVDATKEPVTGVKVSAYKKDNDVVIVVVNTNTAAKTVNFTIPGSSINSLTKYTTSGTKNINKDGTVSATAGAFSTAFDAQSVTTLVYTGAVVTSSSSAMVSSSSAQVSSSSALVSSSSKAISSSSLLSSSSLVVVSSSSAAVGILLGNQREDNGLTVYNVYDAQGKFVCNISVTNNQDLTSKVRATVVENGMYLVRPKNGNGLTRQIDLR